MNRDVVAEYHEARQANEAFDRQLNDDVRAAERRYSLATIALVESTVCPKCEAAEGASCVGAREPTRPVLWSLDTDFKAHSVRLAQAAREAQALDGRKVTWDA